ncbi:hypothetical protein SNEBB_002369 [Seison nebaliae]|nr:hypothetical protein SNEBB_002369 [Seison nebaliae]
MNWKKLKNSSTVFFMLLWLEVLIVRRRPLTIIFEVIVILLSPIIFITARAIYVVKYSTDLEYGHFNDMLPPFPLVKTQAFVIAYYPHNQFTHAIMNSFDVKLSFCTVNIPHTVVHRNFTSQEEMVEWLKNNTDFMTQKDQVIGVTFPDISPESGEEFNASIKLQFAYQKLSDFNEAYVPGGSTEGRFNIDRLYEAKPPLGPRVFRNLADGFIPGYVRHFWITVQSLLMRVIYMHMSDDRIPAEFKTHHFCLMGPALQLAKFPHPKYRNDKALHIIYVFLTLIITISYFVFTTYFTRLLISIRYKYAFILLKIPLWKLWTVKFIRAFIVLTLHNGLLCLVLVMRISTPVEKMVTNRTMPNYQVYHEQRQNEQIIKYSSIIYFFFALQLYATSYLLFVILIASYFKQSVIGAMVCSLLHFLIYLPNLATSNNYNSYVTTIILEIFSYGAALGDLGKLYAICESNASKLTSDGKYYFYLPTVRIIYVCQLTNIFVILLLIILSNITRIRRMIEQNKIFPMSNIEKAMKVSNLNKIYKVNGCSNHALKDVSFTVNDLSLNALLGHNGAGKSTLLRILAGEFPQDSGEIQYCQYRSTVLCPQQNCIISYLTLEEQLQFCAKIRLKDLDWKMSETKISEIITSYSLSKFLHKRTGKLSGGNQRRLTLACTVIGNENLLLLDEPMAGMDVNGRKIVWAALKAESKHRIVIMSTHYIVEAQKYADQAIFMYEGSTNWIKSFERNNSTNRQKIIISKKTESLPNNQLSISKRRSRIDGALSNSTISKSESVLTDFTPFESSMYIPSTETSGLSPENLELNTTKIEEIFVKKDKNRFDLTEITNVIQENNPRWLTLNDETLEDEYVARFLSDNSSERSFQIEQILEKEIVYNETKDIYSILFLKQFRYLKQRKLMQIIITAFSLGVIMIASIYFVIGSQKEEKLERRFSFDDYENNIIIYFENYLIDERFDDQFIEILFDNLQTQKTHFVKIVQNGTLHIYDIELNEFVKFDKNKFQVSKENDFWIDKFSTIEKCSGRKESFEQDTEPSPKFFWCLGTEDYLLFKRIIRTVVTVKNFSPRYQRVMVYFNGDSFHSLPLVSQFALQTFFLGYRKSVDLNFTGVVKIELINEPISHNQKVKLNEDRLSEFVVILLISLSVLLFHANIGWEVVMDFPSRHYQLMKGVGRIQYWMTTTITTGE